MTNFKSELDRLRIHIPLWAIEIVERQYQLEPAFLKYGYKGKLQSIEDAKNNLDYLFSSIEVDSKALFLEYNIWVDNLFKNLNLPTKILEDFYTCLLDLLKREKANIDITDELFREFESYIGIALNKNLQTSKLKIAFDTQENPFENLLEKYKKQYFLMIDQE